MFGIRSTWVALALVVAAVAAPTALAEPPLGAYDAISGYRVHHTAHPATASLAAQTEARGYSAITRYQVQQARESDTAALAAQTEAKGLLALARFWEQHGASSVAVSSPSDGFAWGDASIGAGLTIGVFLVGGAAAIAVRRRQGLGRVSS
jgi:hypothetical protein